jgi:Ca2+-binding RTX toxin-like protein
MGVREAARAAPIILGNGDDVYEGTSGDDVIYGRKGNDQLDGWHGNDFLDGDAGDDRLEGLWGEDTLVGDVGNDWLSGAWDADRLFGGAGNDTLEGDWANDHLDGGSGDDDLDGSYDADVLTGGPGADTFELAYSFLSAPGRAYRDVITDFQPGKGDRIDLSDMDANLQRTGNQKFAWVGADNDPGVGEVGFHRMGGDVIIRGYTGPTPDDGAGYFEIDFNQFRDPPGAQDFIL